MQRRKFIHFGAGALAFLSIPKIVKAQICKDLTQTDRYGQGPFYLDLWHATDSGCYQHPRDHCPEIPGHTENFRLRGK